MQFLYTCHGHKIILFYSTLMFRGVFYPLPFEYDSLPIDLRFLLPVRGKLFVFLNFMVK